MIDPKIAELAEKLGAAMAESKAARDFKRLRHEALADADAQALLKAYQEHLDLLGRKEHERRPIEVEDKQKLRDLQEKTYRNEKLKSLMAGQADYVEMVQAVNDVLGKHLASGEDEAKK
ncbi:MAG: YlbF family regulator [Phycisphaerae bacterium]|nr:YlbF family regulator [Phycisphaerae bacterium]